MAFNNTNKNEFSLIITFSIFFSLSNKTTVSSFLLFFFNHIKTSVKVVFMLLLDNKMQISLLDKIIYIFTNGVRINKFPFNENETKTKHNKEKRTLTTMTK